MGNKLQSLIGERHQQVIAYVSPKTFLKIESLRGDVSRSRFVGKLIEKSIQEDIKNNEESKT